MIFGLHYLLVFSAYSAAGVLLGSYMMRYAGASELDLGFVFMIQPTMALLRPIIGAAADRFQAHKKLLVLCLMGNSISYIPFIMLPFLLKQAPHDGQQPEYLSSRMCFWVLVVSHVIGSFCFCGVRSLGDTLAVNYAKRVGSNFGTYRKFGALGFGTCGYLLGQINENWIMPDYVPSFVVYVAMLGTLGALIHLWPDEYFAIVSERQIQAEKKHPGTLPKLPGFGGVIVHMGEKLVRSVRGCFCQACGASEKQPEQAWKGAYDASGLREMNKAAYESEEKKVETCLSASQQIKILLLLIRYDPRIPMFMFFLFFGGMIGYAPQNFVFTYLDQVCHNRGVCQAAALAGLVMICFCVSETLSYISIATIRPKSFTFMLQLSLLSYMVHYLFYGIVLDHVSPYFFLIESLHGLEYATSLVSSVELGYKFANEVELILPELVERNIISKDDDQELVKVSLMATMNSCFTLAFEGAGTIFGALICGVVISKYSFNTAWNLCGGLAGCGFVFVLLLVTFGRCISWKPKIERKAENKALAL